MTNIVNQENFGHSAAGRRKGARSFMKDYMKIYNEWLSNPYFDEATKAELRAIEGNENEIKERFYMIWSSAQPD